MRKSAFIIFLVLFFAAVAVPGWSHHHHSRGGRNARGVERSAKHRHHAERWAKKAVRAWNRHCNSVTTPEPAEVEKETEPETEKEITKETGDKTLS